MQEFIGTLAGMLAAARDSLGGTLADLWPFVHRSKAASLFVDLRAAEEREADALDRLAASGREVARLEREAIGLADEVERLRMKLAARHGAEIDRLRAEIQAAREHAAGHAAIGGKFRRIVGEVRQVLERSGC